MAMAIIHHAPTATTWRPVLPWVVQQRNGALRQRAAPAAHGHSGPWAWAAAPHGRLRRRCVGPCDRMCRACRATAARGAGAGTGGGACDLRGGSRDLCHCIGPHHPCGLSGSGKRRAARGLRRIKVTRSASCARAWSSGPPPPSARRPKAQASPEPAASGDALGSSRMRTSVSFLSSTEGRDLRAADKPVLCKYLDLVCPVDF